MPSYTVHYKNGTYKEFFCRTCFAGLSSGYAVNDAVGISLELDVGGTHRTLHPVVTIEEVERLFSLLFSDLGFKQWESGIKLLKDRKEGRYYNVTLGRITFDHTVPVPVVVAVCSLFRMSTEDIGRWRAFKIFLDNGVNPRHAVILSTMYRLSTDTGCLVQLSQGEHAIFYFGYQSEQAANYFMTWEHNHTLTGGMKENPTYFGRMKMVAGVEQPAEDHYRLDLKLPEQIELKSFPYFYERFCKLLEAAK